MTKEKTIEHNKVIHDEDNFFNSDMGPFKKSMTLEESIAFGYKFTNTVFSTLSKRISELEKRIDKHIKN